MPGLRTIRLHYTVKGISIPGLCTIRHDCRHAGVLLIYKRKYKSETSCTKNKIDNLDKGRTVKGYGVWEEGKAQPTPQVEGDAVRPLGLLDLG